jgi:hypothetical protein
MELRRSHLQQQPPFQVDLEDSSAKSKLRDRSQILLSMMTKMMRNSLNPKINILKKNDDWANYCENIKYKNVIEFKFFNQ